METDFLLGEHLEKNSLKSSFLILSQFRINFSIMKILQIIVDQIQSNFQCLFLKFFIKHKIII
jgi:hypothetical protein